MEEEEKAAEEEEEEEGWGVFTVTVRVQRSSYNHICCHYEHSFFKTTARGASQPLNMTFLWRDWACFITPPAAPSSGDPYRQHTNKQTL